MPPDPAPTQLAAENPSSPSAPPRVPPAAAVTWTAVVAADRDYYDSVQAANDQDAG